MDKLPLLVLEEVLKKVFEFLPREDRKAGVMVNSKWREVGEAGHLWAWVPLHVFDQNSRARVIDMLSSERLARVETIDIQPKAVSEDLLQALINHTGLKSIGLWRWGREGRRDGLPAGLNPQLVVKALTAKVGDLRLGKHSLPTHLRIALFTELSQGGSFLKKIYLLRNNISVVPEAFVASALTRMVEVRLEYTRLTSEQAIALTEGIDQGGSSIEKLYLRDSLPSMDERTGPLNLQPLVKLEKVRLDYNFLTELELVNFFAAMSPSTKLKRLRINSLPWPAKEVMDGSTGVMARAFNFLEEVELEGVHPYQVYNQQSPEV